MSNPNSEPEYNIPLFSSEKSLEFGRLVLQEENLYAAFQTGLPRDEAMVKELPRTQAYTYAYINGIGWRMTRTEGENDELGSLIPEPTPKEPANAPKGEGEDTDNGARPIEIRLRQSLLVLPSDMVNAALRAFPEQEQTSDRLPMSALAAERLFHRVRGRRLGGVVIEACGTYSGEIGATELVIVDAFGGLSIGLGSRPGIATDEDLRRTAWLPFLPAPRHEPVAEKAHLW